VVRRSLIGFGAGKASFPDFAIGEISRQAGCRNTVSFDRDLRKAPGVTILGKADARSLRFEAKAGRSAAASGRDRQAR
jgi:hypothetical protein